MFWNPRGIDNDVNKSFDSRLWWSAAEMNELVVDYNKWFGPLLEKANYDWQEHWEYVEEYEISHT